MAHKLKALGLALVAVFAFSAVAVSAQATASNFEASSYPATITGEGIVGTVTEKENKDHEFSTKAGVVKCTPASFHGELTKTTHDLKLTATYGNTAAETGCTLSGIAIKGVHMKSCYYTLTSGNEITPTTFGVAAHVVCATPGDVIEITGSGTCTITVGPQSFAESMITAENSGGAGTTEMDVKAFIDVKEIKYETHGVCPNAPVATTLFSDGTYKGVVTLKSEKGTGGPAIGVTVEETTTLAPSNFEASSYPATITGEGIVGTVTEKENKDHEFSTKAGVVKCTPASFHGELTKTTHDLKLTATYGNTAAETGCTLSGIAIKGVHMKSCYYTLTSGNEITPTTFGVAAHVVCATPGDVIEITGSGTCTITVGPQSFAESMITAENSGGAGTTEMDVKAFIDVKEIKYETHGVCPNAPVATTLFSDGTYKGVVTLKSEKGTGGPAIGVTVEETTTLAPSNFEASSYPATITGEGIVGTVTEKENKDHEFSTKAGVVKCTPASFHGELTKTTHDLKLTATYGNTAAETGCTLSGIAIKGVHMKSCYYTLTSGNEITPTTFGVAAHVVCATPGDVIEITGSGTCTITVGPQSFAESMITAENSGGAGTTEMDVKAFIDVKEIKYETHGVCPNAPVATTLFSDGTYKGVVTLKSEKGTGGPAIGVTVEET